MWSVPTKHDEILNMYMRYSFDYKSDEELLSLDYFRLIECILRSTKDKHALLSVVLCFGN